MSDIKKAFFVSLLIASMLIANTIRVQPVLPTRPVTIGQPGSTPFRTPSPTFTVSPPSTTISTTICYQSPCEPTGEPSTLIFFSETPIPNILILPENVVIYGISITGLSEVNYHWKQNQLIQLKNLQTKSDH